ncbi:MAG: hypothetical protein AABX02_00735 [archaeon]
MITLIRFLFVLFLVFFLSCVWYWFLRTKRIPSLALVLRTMLYSTKWFPKILVHRVRILPARVRRIVKRSDETIPAFPASKKKTARTVFRKKRRK